MSDTKEPKIARKDVIVALGIICIILVACLLGVVAAYTIMINDKSNTISSLNYHISELNSTVANLQKQVASDNSTIDSLKSLVANLQSRLANTVEGVNEQLGLQLTMTLEKTNYSLFEPINIYFTITNISNQTISLAHDADPYNFEFRVFSDTNNSIWSLIYPVYAGINPGGPLVTATLLNPEESLTGFLEWEQICNNTGPDSVSPGTYYIVGQIGPIFLNGLTIETTPIQIVIA
jgi:flagellar basal body-associated protein FliL